MDFRQDAIQAYLSSVFGHGVSIHRMVPIGGVDAEGALKHFGYGCPVRIDFQIGDQPPRSAVFHTMRPNPFGHEFMADRAQAMLWAHSAFNQLPLHARSIDVGGVRDNKDIVSLSSIREPCQLTEYVEGEGYNLDLQRLRETDELTDLDLARADTLCDYLAEIHQVPGSEAGLYTRRIRELVGHGECVMGLVDSYPPHAAISPAVLENIEQQCLHWRWKIKSKTHRLRQIHGDYHPWNILFGTNTSFRVLDRSRGEWGEPADDVTSLTLNYVFFSLQREGRVTGALGGLFLRFWERYLAATNDQEILKVAAPFFAFRCLVLASPIWYPALADDIRRTILRFALNVLGDEEFDPTKVNHYCGA